jgi:hypothetical protein
MFPARTDRPFFRQPRCADLVSIHGGPFSRRPQGGQEQGGRLQTWASKTGEVVEERPACLSASTGSRRLQQAHLEEVAILALRRLPLRLSPGGVLGGRPESREKGTLEAQRGAASSTEEGAIHCRRAFHFALCQLAATVILRVHAEASFPIDLCARICSRGGVYSACASG